MINKLISLIISLLSISISAQANRSEVFELITDEGGFMWSKTSLPEVQDTNQNVLAIRSNISPDIYFTTGIDDASVKAGLDLEFCDEISTEPCIKRQIFSAFPTKYLSDAQVSAPAQNKNLMGIPKHNYQTNFSHYPNDVKYFFDDGKHGLDIMTAIFNVDLSNGMINYDDILITEESIGDDIPDVIITQTGGLTANVNLNDRYFFANKNGVIDGEQNNTAIVVGDLFVVDFSEIGVVMKGEWVFYNYRYDAPEGSFLTSAQFNSNVSNSASGVRDTRVLAFDWADLGINLTNYMNVKSFNQKFNGASDVAFIAYNESSLRFVRDISGNILKVDLDGITKEPFPSSEIEVELYLVKDGVQSVLPIAVSQIDGLGNYKFLEIPSNFSGDYYRVKIKLNDTNLLPYYVVENVDQTLKDYVQFDIELDDVVNRDFVLGNFCMKEPKLSTTIGRSSPVAVSTMEKRPEDWPGYIPNAFLVLDSKEKGFVIPRTTSNQIDAASLIEGMMIYDTVDNCIKIYDGSKWYCIKRDCN